MDGQDILFKCIITCTCANEYLYGRKEKRKWKKYCPLEVHITNKYNSCVKLWNIFPVGLLNALCFFGDVFLALFIVFSGIISFSQLLYICTCFWYVKSFILGHDPLAHSIPVHCFQRPLSSVHSDMFIFSFPVGLWTNASELVMMFAH